MNKKCETKYDGDGISVNTERQVFAKLNNGHGAKQEFCLLAKNKDQTIIMDELSFD
jgi:hypothetical protein